MAAASQVPYVPVEVYLRSSYEPDAEYVDGVIEERPVGEWSHGDWQAAIVEFFRSRRKEWGIRAAGEVRVQVRSNRFRIPDVTVVDRSFPAEQIITRPPIAVFEILSPEDYAKRLITRLNDYEQMGIQTILVLDPDGGKHFHFRNGALQPLTETAFDLPGSKCRFDLAEIEKLLD